MSNLIPNKSIKNILKKIEELNRIIFNSLFISKEIIIVYNFI